MFAHHFVAGREIQKDCRPSHGLGGAGWIGHPEVFTQFHTHYQSAYGSVLKQDIHTKWHLNSIFMQHFRLVAHTRGKMAGLVKFLMIGQVGFGH